MIEKQQPKQPDGEDGDIVTPPPQSPDNIQDYETMVDNINPNDKIL